MKNDLIRIGVGCLYDSEQAVYYCSVCWDNNGKKIAIDTSDTGQSLCPICKNKGVWSKEKDAEFVKENIDFLIDVNDL